jgi:TatA/E family protein of Tat protein translocase
MFSIPHLIVIFVVVLIVFGPQKLPELARGLGKLMAEFRKASADFKGAFEQEMREMERQTAAAERKKQADAAAALAATEPATLATPAGSETTPAAEESAADTRMTEAPVITPVPESVPRSSDDSSAAADNGAGAAHPEATAGTEPEHDSASPNLSHDPSHDLRRPA